MLPGEASCRSWRGAPDDDGEASLAPTARGHRRSPPAPPPVQRWSPRLHQTPRPSTSWCRPSRAVGSAPRRPAPPLLRPTTLEGTPPPPPPPYGRRGRPSASSRGSRRSRRPSQRHEAQGEVTVLGTGAARAGAGRVAAPRPPPRAPRARTTRRRGDGVDVRACVSARRDRCASIEDERPGFLGGPRFEQGFGFCFSLWCCVVEFGNGVSVDD